MKFVRPYALVPNGPYYLVVDALGVMVAQGSHATCEAVVAGRMGTFCYGGDLFNATN